MEATSVRTAISVYQRFARAENKSRRTIESYTAAVGHFDGFLGGCCDVRQVTAGNLRDYITHLQTRPRWTGHPTIRDNHGPLSPDAVACYVRGIRSFWSWLLREEFIDDNPLQKVKPPKVPKKHVDPLTPEQVTDLLKSIPRNNLAGYRETTILLILYATGLRISEALELNLGDVNLDSGQLHVVGKGDKERVVFLSAKAYKGLHKYLGRWRPNVASDRVFIHADGRPLTRFYFAHRLHHFAETAGINGKCGAHIFRYSFSVQFLRNGGDIFSLQQILGHSTLTMTRRYAQIADSDVEAKLKQYSPAENLAIRI